MGPSLASPFWKKWITIFGAFLIVLTTSFEWSWGNTSIYAISYVLKHHQPSDYNLQPWTGSLHVVFYTVGFLLAGMMYTAFSKKIVMAIGIVLCAGSTTVTFWAIEYSVTGLNITLGVVLGAANGILNAVGFQYAADWAEGDTGLLMAIVLSGNNIGAIIETQFVTMFTNPHNKVPDIEYNSYKFFSQDDVVNRVPTMFLVLGASYLAIHVIGFVMLRDKPSDPSKTVPSTPRYTEERGDDQDARNESSVQEIVNYTPSQAIRCRQFYIVMVAFTVTDMATFTVKNYYKAYGQLFIKDDHFLTYTGVIICIGVLIGKLLWGYIMDRMGVKSCLAIFLSFLSVCVCFYYFCPLMSKWGYLIFSLPVSCCLTVIATFAGVVAKLFGEKYFASNFGFVTILSLALILVLPVIIQKSISRFGWFSIFFICSIPSLGALLLVVLFLPHDKKVK